MNEEFYIVVSGYYAGVHKVTVRLSAPGMFSVNGDPFGCSRDYRQPSKIKCIEMLMAEHGCKLVRGISARLLETYLCELYKMGTQRTFRDMCDFVMTDKNAITAFELWCWQNSDG